MAPQKRINGGTPVGVNSVFEVIEQNVAKVKELLR
jgi:hypothetical protein